MKVTKAVVNKTQKPLKISLPQGKALHLGPRQKGQISIHSLEHPPVKQLLEEKKIDIFDAAEHDEMLPPDERVDVA